MTAAWILLASVVILTILCAVPFAKMCGKYGKKEKAAEHISDTFDPEKLSCYAYDGAELSGVLLNAENPEGTLILFHGWHSSWQRDFGTKMGFLRGLGLNLLFCDERAHGASKGGLTTLGTRECRDVASWVTATEQLFGENHPIFLLGMDMGAAAATMASDNVGKSVRGIIAVSGYSDARDMIKGRNRKAPGFAALLTELFALGIGRFGFAEKTAADGVKKSDIPLLMIHGAEDAVIPLDMAKELFAACGSEKHFVTVDSAGHDECFEKGGEQTEKVIKAFIEANI